MTATPLTFVELGPHHEKDVMEISALTFGGHDWIASAFPAFVKNEYGQYHIFGYEDERGKLIAMFVLRRDGGAEFEGYGALEGLRVHPDFRGRGLSHDLQRRMIDYARTQQKDIHTLRYTTYNLNHASISVATKSGMQIARRFPYVMVSEHAEEGKDTVFITFPREGIKEFREKVIKAREKLGISRNPSLPRVTDPGEVREALRRARQTVVLQYWKPVDVDGKRAFEKLCDERGFYGFASPHGFSLGIVVKDGLGHLGCFGHYPYPTTPPETVVKDLVMHLGMWMDDDKAVARPDSIWFCYEEVAYEGLCELGIARREKSRAEMQHEILFEYKLRG